MEDEIEEKKEVNDFGYKSTKDSIIKEEEYGTFIDGLNVRKQYFLRGKDVMLIKQKKSDENCLFISLENENRLKK